MGKADAALSRRDGVAAEAHLVAALKAGAKRDAVRAAMGEALLLQGDLVAARQWLDGGRFAPGTEADGERMRGRLDQAEGHFREAGRAYDRALRLAPGDPLLWVDMARLRFAGGDQRQAIAAADHALALDPKSAPALGLRAALIRSQFGLAASLPWFAAALKRAPDDPDLLADYAATVGEMGRARDMLALARRLNRAAPHDARAFYLQAVLAARAGRDGLARRLLDRTGGRLKNTPGAILLAGVLDYRSGNFNVAIEHFDRLLRLQPENAKAQELLARSLLRGGDAAAVVARFDPLAQRSDASPYLLTLVARAHEELGGRERAASYLERASAGKRLPIQPLPADAPLSLLAQRGTDSRGDAAAVVPYLRGLVAAGQIGPAVEAARRLRESNPGAPDADLLVGDVALASGNPTLAMTAYQAAARVRFGEAELLRMEAALLALGHPREAEAMLRGFLAQNPQSATAARLLAAAEARAGAWEAAAARLAAVQVRFGADSALLADLAFAQVQQGNATAAGVTAARAARLQPARRAAAEAWALALEGDPRRVAELRALRTKTARMGAPPVLLAAR